MPAPCNNFDQDNLWEIIRFSGVLLLNGHEVPLVAYCHILCSESFV